jgi:hypothetical protein
MRSAATRGRISSSVSGLAHQFEGARLDSAGRLLLRRRLHGATRRLLSSTACQRFEQSLFWV